MNHKTNSDRRKTQTVIFITVFLGFISYSLPYPIFSPLFLSTEHSFLPSAYSTLTRTIILGIAMVLYPLGQFLGNPIIGHLSDRFGRKKLLVLALIGTGLCDFSVAIAIAHQQLWLILLSLFGGGFAAGNITIAQATAAELSTSNTKTKNFGLVNIAMNGGWIFGCLLGGKLADDNLVAWFNYSTPFYFSALAYLCNLLLVFWLFPDSTIRMRQKLQIAAGFFAQIQKKSLRNLYAYTLLVFIASYFYFCYFAVFMVQKFNFGPSQIANFEAYLAVPLILANYLLSPTIRYFGLARTSYLSMFALAVTLLIFLIPTSAWSMLLTVPLVAIGLTFAEVTSALLISNAVSNKEQGATLGTYRSLVVLGEIIASLVGGYLAGLHYNSPFFAGAITAVMAGALLLWHNSRRTQHPVSDDLRRRDYSHEKHCHTFGFSKFIKTITGPKKRR